MSTYRVQLIGMCFAAFFAVLFLLHVGLFGYVIQLDMIFGPESAVRGLEVFNSEGSLYALLVYFGSTIFTAQVFQRILFTVYICALFYVPYLSLCLVYKNTTKKYIGMYIIGSILFACNPFVYMRVLSGQWNIVFGYALVPLVAVLAYNIDESKKNIPLIVTLLLLLLAVSPQVCFVVIVSLVLFLILEKKWLNLLQIYVPFGIAGSYILYKKVEFIHAFSTGSVSEFFQSLNWYEVLTFSGFWLEKMPWSDSFFIATRDLSLPTFLTMLLFLFGVGFVIYKLRKRYRVFSVFSVLIVACVCAVYGDVVFKHSVYLSHIFRDTTKWQVIPITILYFVFTYGLVHINTRMRLLYIYVPLYFLSTSIVGVYHAVHAYEYTNQVYEVSELLKQEKKCKMLVLPWHQYYSRVYISYDEIKNVILTANPARHIYPCTVISSIDGGMSEVRRNGVRDELQRKIDGYIKSGDTALVIPMLKEYGVTHILFETSVLSEDPYKYNFLKGLTPEFQDTSDLDTGIVLYRL